MAFAMLLSIIVVVPVFALTIWIVWKYRESNVRTKKKYQPDWDRSWLYESIWWGIPMTIILILSVVAWQSAHHLDPYRQLASDKKPLTIQVVSLDWKWLFIYPEQHVASVNQVAIPINTPVDFKITSDTVMNSFWIPQLGGQIYAMPGMVTQLHLMADKTGNYFGTPANITGKGFSTMTFRARASTAQGFEAWLKQAAASPDILNENAYQALAKPSENNPVVYYSAIDPNLFDNIVMNYMMPKHSDMKDMEM